MTLIITAIAAVVAAIIWYMRTPSNVNRVGVLALMYGAAALMWCVDGIASLIEGNGFIELADGAVMRDDALLGIVVVVVGLAAWAVYLLVVNRNRKSDCKPAN